MKHWANYSLDTGRLLQIYALPDEAQPFDIAGTGVIETPDIAAEAARDYRVVDGVLVLQPIPPSPGSEYQLDLATQTWVLRDLADLQALKWQEMKDVRQAAIEAPLATPYGVFDADPASRQNIVNTAQLVQTAAQSLTPGAQPTVDFTLHDNTVVTLSASDMVNVALALAQQVQGAYARGRQVRDAINAATTPEEVAAITWSPPP